MDASPLHLTFGVELEFIVRSSPEVYQDGLGDDLLAAEGMFSPTDFERYGALVRLHMIQILNQSGFPTYGYRASHCNQDTNFSKWTVDTDSSVNPVDDSGDWVAIELKTPVLDCSPPSLEKIRTVVKLLVSHFKLHINESCGLHVHVGNGNSKFPLSTLRSFCSLITVFEHQLDSLHQPGRLPNPYAKSTHRAFADGASPREKLSIVDELTTVRSLIRRFQPSGDKHMAFNFLNLSENTDAPLRTIEFRQHRGTLDPELISYWVMVACGLVSMSHSDSSGVRDLIEKQINNTNYTVIDLFRDLSLPYLAEFYAPRVFPQYGTDQKPAKANESTEHKGPGSFDMSPGKYDTPWEKIFAPRPPSELGP